MREQLVRVRKSVAHLFDSQEAANSLSWDECNHRIQQLSSLSKGRETANRVSQLYRALSTERSNAPTLDVKPFGNPIDPVWQESFSVYNGHSFSHLEMGSDSDANINERLRISSEIPAYFHGTSRQESLMSMLKGGRVDVERGTFPGAFVSTQPERGFAPFYFAFRRSIEFANPLISGQAKGSEYWPAFSEGILTDERSLQCILVGTKNSHGEDIFTEQQCLDKCQEIQIEIGKIFDDDRNITVLPLSEMNTICERKTGKTLWSLGKVIPRQWDDSKDRTVYHQNCCASVEADDENCDCVVSG